MIISSEDNSWMSTAWPYLRDSCYMLAALGGLTAYTWSAWSRKENDRRVRYAATHAMTHQAIAGLYERVALVQDEAEKARSGSLGNDMTPWRNSVNDLRAYQQQKRIWLPRSTVEKFDKLWFTLRKAGFAHEDQENTRARGLGSHLSDQEVSELVTRYDRIVQEEVLPAKAELEAELRAVLELDRERC